MLQIIDNTCHMPHDNIALDETLLDQCERQPKKGGFLRFWESQNYFVVMGRSGKMSEEVHPLICEKDRVPILRRASGGGTVLQGQGCLNYALILPIQSHPSLATIGSTNTFIMTTLAQSLQSIIPDIQVSGYTDLTMNQRKFSGNAQRRKREALLFHGTFLYDFDLEKVTRYLRMPPKQPAYRQHRSHQDFIQNCKQSPETIKTCLTQGWRYY